MRLSAAAFVLTIITGASGTACWREEVSTGAVTLCEAQAEGTELRVHFRDRGRGSAHYPSIHAFDDLRFDVIRVPGRQGRFEAGAIELSRYEGTGPARVEGGHVTLAADTVEIDLRLPVYDRETRAIAGSRAYRFNGRFALRPGGCDPGD